VPTDRDCQGGEREVFSLYSGPTDAPQKKNLDTLDVHDLFFHE